MGNHTSRETFPDGDILPGPDPKSRQQQALSRQRALKTSETEPNLLGMGKGARSLTSKHSHHQSIVGGNFLNQSTKKQVLSAMTSRVLMNEQLNTTNPLNQFLSTTNLHNPTTRSAHPVRDLSGVKMNQFSQNISTTISEVSAQPLQSISNIQSVQNRVTHKLPPPANNKNTFSSFMNNNTSQHYTSTANQRYQQQQQEADNSTYLDQSNYQQQMNQTAHYARMHSKSAHVSAMNMTQQSYRQSPRKEEKTDFQTMQQRLLKKLKNGHTNTKKKTSFAATKENGQVKPKRPNSRYQQDSQSKPPASRRTAQMQRSPDFNQDKKFVFETNMINTPVQEYVQSPINMIQPIYQPINVPPAPRSFIIQQRLIKFGAPGASLISSDIVMSLISYDSTLFTKFLLLSPQWHTYALQAMDEHCNKIENEFIQICSEFLFYRKSFTSSMPIEFCRQKGLRLDRAFECEVLPHKSLMTSTPQTLRFGYTYTLANDTRSYKVEYKLDILPATKPRLTWLHQDYSNRETYTQPIQQVCVGDSIEFAIGISSLQGFVSKIEWEFPTVVETPRITVGNYNKDWARKLFKETSVKIICDLNRICEVEDAVVEWYEEAYYPNKQALIDLSFLKACFDIKQVFYAGIDGAICKAILTPKREGTIEKSRLGLEIQVKGQSEEVVSEVKRLGYMKDREVPIQTRVGDTVIVYISQANA